MKTLTCLGTAVSLEAEDGRIIELRGAMLYDDSGQAWPRCSLLVTPFQRTGITSPKDVPRFSRDWLKKDGLREGRVSIPTRSLESWNEGPKVRVIYYTRAGAIHDPFEHPFGTMGGILGRMVPWRFSTMPTLYRRNGAARLDLGSGCVIDASGIVSP